MDAMVLAVVAVVCTYRYKSATVHCGVACFFEKDRLVSLRCVKSATPQSYGFKSLLKIEGIHVELFQRALGFLQLSLLIRTVLLPEGNYFKLKRHNDEGKNRESLIFFHHRFHQTNDSPQRAPRTCDSKQQAPPKIQPFNHVSAWPFSCNDTSKWPWRYQDLIGHEKLVIVYLIASTKGISTTV
jgi:hypothetical protein